MNNNNSDIDKTYWYKLDNLGKIYPSTVSKRFTAMFRLSVTMKEPISVKYLQNAIDIMLNRCPYYNVELKRGFFWYYLNKSNTKPKLVAETKYPCQYIPLKKNGVLPIKFLAYQNRISIEIAHFVTDGTGLLYFLNALIFEYLKQMGYNIDPENMPLTGNSTEKLDTADSFKKYYDPTLPSPEKETPAQQIPGKKVPRGEYYFIRGIIPSLKLKEVSKSYNVPIGEFLTALLIESIILSFKEKNKKITSPIKVFTPINLRKLYPSNTIRNFFLGVTPSIDARLGDYSFKEILEKVHYYIKYEVDSKFIKKQITRNVKGELNAITRVFPLFIKDILLKIISNTSERKYSTISFSNIGLVKVPKDMEKHILNYNIIPPPSIRNISGCVISFNGKTNITFGSIIYNTDIERIFFRKLVGMGIPVEIISNRS